MPVQFSIDIYSNHIHISIPRTDFSKDAAVVFSGNRLEVDIELMKQLTVVLHRELQKREPYIYLLLKLFDQFDYVIESQLDLSPAYMEQLSYALQLHLRMRRLVVNGRELALPLRRRNFEHSMRLFFVEFIPLLAMFLSALFMPPYFRANPWRFLAFLLIVVYLLRFLGKGIWMVVLRMTFPWGYVDNLLHEKRKSVSLFDRFWIWLVWKVKSFYPKEIS